MFFVGDSAGHCLPTTAEGIRPALILGTLLGEELRAVVEGRQDAGAARAAYAALHAGRRFDFEASSASSSPSASCTARCSTASRASSAAAASPSGPSTST